MSPEKAHDPAALLETFTFFNEIGIVNQLVTTRFERALPDGLTMAQFSVLNHLVRLGGPRTPASLAAAFQVTRAAMTNTVSRLHQQGFVSVVPNPGDGRGKHVDITPDGIAARDRAIQSAATTFADFRAAFEPGRLRAALPLLQEIRAWLDTHRAPPAASA